MESHTRVTYRRNPGFLERIGQSLIGILVGIVLLIVASCLLFWNEVTLHYVTFNGKTMYLALWGRGGGGIWNVFMIHCATWSMQMICRRFAFWFPIHVMPIQLTSINYLHAVKISVARTNHGNKLSLHCRVPPLSVLNPCCRISKTGCHKKSTISTISM